MDGGSPAPIEWYRVCKKLGKGGYASVYQVTDVLTGRDYAMKKYKLADRGDGLNSSILKDFTVSAVTQHPSIVRVWRVHQTRRHVYVFMDLYCVSLQDILLYIHRHCVSQCPGGWDISSASMDEGTPRPHHATAVSGPPEPPRSIDDRDGGGGAEVRESPYCADLILRFVSTNVDSDVGAGADSTAGAGTTRWRQSTCTRVRRETTPPVSSPQRASSSSSSSSSPEPDEAAVGAATPAVRLRYTTPGEESAAAAPSAPTHAVSKAPGASAVPPALSSASMDKVTLLQRYIDPLLLHLPIATAAAATPAGRSRELHLLPEQVVLHWFHQCVQGLTHLYSRRFTNGDLKPGNVMIDLTANRACLIDFNLCQTVHRSLDRLEYPTWTVRPPEYDHPTVDLHPHAVEAWTAGCLLLMLLTAQPTLFDHDVRSQMESCERRRVRGAMVQAFWCDAGILPVLDRARCYARFPALKRYSSFACELAFRLLAPTPLDRANLFDVERQLQQHRFPRPGPHARSLLTAVPSSPGLLRRLLLTTTDAATAAASSTAAWLLRLPHVAVMDPGEQRAARFRFHPDTIACAIAELALFCRACTRDAAALAMPDRAYVIRRAVNAAQLQWMTRAPPDVDGSEVLLLALSFFDALLCANRRRSLPDRTTDQQAHMYNHCLLLSERIVFNTNYTLGARTGVLGETCDALVDGMQAVVAVQRGNMQPTTFYTLMRMLVELQFGVWKPHLRASASASASAPSDTAAPPVSTPAPAPESAATGATAPDVRTLSWQRGVDAMGVLQAVLVDPQCYQLHPVQLCLAVWWVCQGKWTRAERQPRLGWDGRVEPALMAQLQHHAPGTNLSSHCLIFIASRHLLPLLADLVGCRQLPHPLLATMREFLV